MLTFPGMTFIAVLPVLCLIVGLLIWALNTTPPKTILPKMGEWMFVAGLFVALYVFAAHIVRLP